MAEKKLTGLAKYLAAIRDTADEYGLYQTPSALTPLLRTFTPDSHAFSGEPPPVSRPESIHPGTLLMGQSPEEIQRWLEGNSPFMRKPSSEGAPVIRSIPGRSGNIASDAFRFKEGRIQPTADTAFLGADIGGLAGLAARGIRGGVRATYPALNPEMNMSRREFMGNTGKIAAGAVAASILPAALRGAEHAAPIVEHAAPIVESAAAHTASAVARGVAHADYQALKNLAILRAKNAERAALEASPDKFANSPEIRNVYEETLENEMRKIKEHPQFKNFESIDDIHAREAEELNALKNEYNELSGLKDVPKDYRSFDRTYVKSARYDNSFDKLRRTSEDYRLRSDEIKAKYDKLLAEYNAKHGYLSADEVYERMKTDPNFKYIDPYTNREYVWINNHTNTPVPYDPKYDPKIQAPNSERGPNDWKNDIVKGYIDPETGKVRFGSGDAGTNHDLKSEQYYLDYLKNRGIAPDGSSTTSLPDGYRFGGRVRMI